MTAGRGRRRSRAGQVEAGAAFFAGRAMRTAHFAAMWHSFSVGRLLGNDLDRIGRRHGIGIADFHLLGALLIDAPAAATASDLALTLNVSNAVLSGRVARLEREGLLARAPCGHDGRVVELAITPEGAARVETVGLALEREARFIRSYDRLPPEDRAALGRIMGVLHEDLDRDFLPVTRPDA